MLVFLVVVLPNLFNEREEKAFSDDYRLAVAKDLAAQPGDSVTIVPGKFYNRSGAFEWFLGSNYRDLWQEAVKVPVLDLQKVKGGLTPTDFSGGQQTIGIEAKDLHQRMWSMRSVNKDQANALAGFLKPTFLRPMFRDQSSSLNPYAALVTARLAEAIEIHHDHPELYYFPYIEKLGKYNERMAGRLVLLNEEVDEGWSGFEKFGNPTEIVDSDEMLKQRKEKNIPVDSVLYLRSRLFDLLISDWDRHEGNWKWVLKKQESGPIFEPFPVDRDMAFYQFGEGIINKFALLFNDKFQSFTPDYRNIKGLLDQSRDLDAKILKKTPREEFLKQADFLQQKLTRQDIEAAFREYPANAYEAVGPEHQYILRQRLENLPDAAKKFYRIIQKD